MLFIPIRLRQRYDGSQMRLSQVSIKPELHVKSEFRYVTVLHNVLLALQPQLPSSLGLLFAAKFNKVAEGHHLGLDEPLLEVGMDDASSLRGGVALVNRPCAGLLLPRS